MGAEQNIERLVTNIRDRYIKPFPPSPDRPIAFPSIDQSQTAVRGMMIPQMAISNEASLIENAILFQFNPETITYTKAVRYTSHERLGYASDIPFWVAGGARNISFKLTLDGTASSQYKNMAVRPGANNSYSNDNNIPNGSYVNLNDYYNSADGNGNGLLKEIAKFEALLYPMVKNGTGLVDFNFGMVEVSKIRQFDNPPYVLFTYGDVAANCFVTSLDREDVLFNRKLNPIRTELTIQLSVIEAKVLDKNFVANRSKGGGNSFGNGTWAGNPNLNSQVG